MSTTPVERDGAGETLAGYLAATAIFVGALALMIRPLPLSLASLLLALSATAVGGGRFARLQAFAVGAATLAFILGMTIAVVTNRPLY
ncbi:MAG TPA: hypothetical protein VE444_05275 [Gaiellaceae bacterium]|nr:hypothetical protein [Gaiellaceae bacterium]